MSHFNALLWESIILLLPSPNLQRLPYCNTIARPLRNIRPIAILSRAHCAIYAPPPTLPLYAIHHTLLVMAISLCKGSQQGGIIRGQHLSSYTQQVPTPCESAPTTTEPSVRNLFSVAAAMLRFIVTPPADYPCTEGWLRTTIPFLKRATPPPGMCLQDLTCPRTSAG